MKHHLLALCIVSLLKPLGAWAQDSSKIDDPIAAELSEEGIRYERSRSVTVVERGSLSLKDSATLAAQLNQGIVDIESFLGVKFDRAHYGATKITYFVGDSISKSHVYGGYSHNKYTKAFVFLPARKVKQDRAPYLHETTHILAWSFSSLWLREGFATYVQNSVNAKVGMGRVRTFGDETEDANSDAVELAKQAGNSEALEMIGRNGKPQFSDQGQRRVFYALAESFVNFLGARLDVSKMKEIYFAENTSAAIRDVSGRSVEEWKKLWLADLKQQAGARG
jgi:hypothetical protein